LLASAKIVSNSVCVMGTERSSNNRFCETLPVLDLQFTGDQFRQQRVPKRSERLGLDQFAKSRPVRGLIISSSAATIGLGANSTGKPRTPAWLIPGWAEFEFRAMISWVNQL
jgi:hypothetical protein